ALSTALLKFGEVSMDAGAVASARNAFNESTAIRLDLAHAAPNDLRAAKALATALERVGIAAHAAGDHHAARGAWEDELLLADRLHPNDDDIEGIRFRATIEAHLAALTGPRAETHRVNALAHFDVLAKAGVLTEREAAMRRKLWGG